MEKEPKKQQSDLKKLPTYNLTDEQKKLIEASKEVKTKSSLYYGSKSSCCSKNTKIMIPSGEVNISEIKIGDIVLSEGYTKVSVIKVNKVPVINHKVLSVCLDDRTKLEVSPMHPTSQGKNFGDLRCGDVIDGRTIISIELVDYNYTHTYDILPDSPSGNYYANGVLIGSTLYKKDVATVLKAALRAS